MTTKIVLIFLLLMIFNAYKNVLRLRKLIKSRCYYEGMINRALVHLYSNQPLFLRHRPVNFLFVTDPAQDYKKW